MKKFLLVLCAICLAAMGLASTALADTPVAAVQSLTPEAWASGGPDGRRELNAGSPLRAHDSLHTSSTGRLAVRFSDGTELNMQGSTSVDIVDYLFDENVNFTVNIGAGAATLVTGAIVQQNPEAFKITTPLGTVGVRGTTVYVSVTNDKVSIVVTDMAPGHSVTIMGLDGNSVTITEPGMQVDLIRGEPTPASPAPASAETVAAIESPDDDTYSELPHRDTGEQSMLIMEQDMNAVNVVIPVPDGGGGGGGGGGPTPAPRTTYPAFIMGITSVPGMATGPMDSLLSSMSGDGRYVAMAGDMGGNIADYYLWDASDGSHTLLGSYTTVSRRTTEVSADGSRVLVGYTGTIAGNYVYDTVNPPGNYPLVNTDPFLAAPLGDNPSNTAAPNAFSGNGLSLVGSYTSEYITNTLLRTDPAVGRWDFDGASYVQVPVLDGFSNPVPGIANHANDDASIIAGATRSIAPSSNYPAYWVRQGATDIYTEYSNNSVSGQIYALSRDGRWGVGNDSFTSLAFRVDTSNNNYELINPLPGETSIYMNAISGDGQVLGGGMNGSANARALFWTPTGGVQTVAGHLTSHGVNVGSAVLSWVKTISDDGSILLCEDWNTKQLYIVRIDGDYLGIANPTNIYASIAGVSAGSNANVISTLPIASLSNTSGFSMGAIPAAGETDTSGGSVLRVWGSGTFMSDYGVKSDDQGAMGAAGATYFMDNGFSIGGGVFYSYRDVETLWNSRQENQSISFGLYGGYAPQRTGVRLSLGAMWQNYDLDSRRNYPNGGGIDTSTGKGQGWGAGLTGHAGWVFGLSESVTLQPFAEYTFQRIATPDYTESGGAFPVTYDRHYFNQNITRVGADLQWDILPTLNLQAWLAWNHRFEDEGPASSGNIIGWDSYYFPGARLKQDWGDTGIGLRWRVYDNTTLGFRLGFGIDNDDSGLSDILGSLTVSVDI